ncbi:MAG: hypothetical protein IKE60_21700 [Reyranella sp.]|uniref:di-heme-cytochrome C peroxidase n=1 Tax=Reyranella sp. TaxID=1929291 RepID=UPI0025F78676|nr:di-heme-cytochrome C peroxidase [Reyranella sp.]MBR2817288.1 hypothetical protein [Reyranella sp.]
MRSRSTFWSWIRRVVVLVVALVAVAVMAVLVDPQGVARFAKRVSGDAALLANLVPPPVPAPTPVERAYWLDQSWSHRDRFWFHHASQGTATIPVPYDWFVELERAELAPFSTPGRLADSDYLRRFGFISSPRTTKGSTFDGKAPQDGYHGPGPASVSNAGERDRLIGYPSNPDGLPVGFARLEAGKDPTTGKPFPAQLGFTCAACHTGHLEYKKVSLRFDGGPAMLNLGTLEPAIALSIIYTLKVPGRFDRFADRVAKRSGDQSGWQDKAALRRELEDTLKKIIITKKWEAQSSGVPGVEEGFGRLDALNRIGNQVFFEDVLPLGPDELAKLDADHLPRVPKHLAGNFAPIDAPVSFPPIWDTPFFLWAQYDASIFNELVRNAGEALGVAARINLTGKDTAQLFASTVHVPTIVEIENMLRGTDPLAGGGKSFKGLAAPQWSDAAKIFPGDAAWTIDATKVTRGRELYRSMCVECHRGPVRDAEFDRKWPDLSFWAERSPDRADPNWINIGGRNYVNVVQKPVAVLGTDAQQSRVLSDRRVVMPPNVGLKPVAELNARSNCGIPDAEGLNAAFGIALMAVVDRAIDRWFVDHPTTEQEQRDMRGPRPNCPNPRTFTMMAAKGQGGDGGQVVPHYRARPLDGVWATGPYLHNGSVPTLQAMLLPQGDRPKKFCVGNRQFDPKDVGLVAEALPCAQGLTTFDTSELANSNRGHSFEGTETDVKKLPAGVVGRGLSPTERDELIEYLKTL